MLFRNVGNLVRTVTSHRLLAAVHEPLPEFPGTFLDHVEHEFVVISHDGIEKTAFAQPDQPVDHARRVWAAIDEIAQKNQRIGKFRLNSIQNGVKSRQTAMNIADRYHTLRHNEKYFAFPKERAARKRDRKEYSRIP